MIIKQKRIHKLEPYTRLIPTGDDLVVGVASPAGDRLRAIGFSNALENGETVLPTPVGHTSLFNAEGKNKINRDLPKETLYRTAEWTWTELHGKDRVERTAFVDIPYQRYPRIPIPPPSMELVLATDADGVRVVRTSIIKNWKTSPDSVIHAVNLMLELFGECLFYDAEMKRLIAAPVKRLTWNLLPPGRRPFAALKAKLAEVLADVKTGKLSFTEHRLETVNAYKPDFAAVGNGGFRGYVVLGFVDRNLYVLESLLYGNATYVFEENWENLSKKTKAEILDKRLQKERLVHHKNWAVDVASLLKIETSK